MAANYFNRRKKASPFTGENPKTIDYKDIDLLKEYILESGRIIPSRITGMSAKHQRRLTHAIKVARYLSLLKYCDRHD